MSDHATEPTVLAADVSEVATLPRAPAPAEAPPSLPRGELLGRYVVLETLGSGGMGSVHAAYDPELDRKVAIKVLRTDQAGSASESHGARLLREAQAMARLAHPNVITVYDVGTFGDQVFVAMELVDGETLGAWLTRERRAWPAIVRVFIAAGRGLAAAHAVGLVHRDFKPDNVLIGRDGRVRVLDFGLARQVGAAEGPQPVIGASSELLTSDLTRAGAIIGTPAYMSPEQHLGVTADARSDQYSFCVALYEALYGQRPYSAASYLGLVAAVTREPPRQPPRGDAPTSLARIVLRGLERDPERRYPGMDALLADLAVDRVARRRRSLALAACLGLTLAAGAGLLEEQHVLAQRCDGEHAAIAERWTPAVADEVQRAFLATGVPHAEATWTRVSTALDRYTAALADASLASCRQTLVDGAQSEEDRRLRGLCFDHLAARLGSTVALLRGASRDDLVGAIDATLDLPPPSTCDDPQVLAVHYAGYERPATRAAVEALRRELDLAAAQATTGREEAALAAVRALEPRAAALAFPPLLAEVGHLHGRMAAGIDRHESADALHRGLLAAIASGHDRLAAEIAVESALLEAWSEGQHEAGHRWLDRAEAWLGRSGDAPRIQASILALRGTIFHYQQRFADAREALERGLELAARADLGPRPRADLLRKLASTEWSAGENARARELWAQSLALDREIFGDDHPEIAFDLNNMGVQEIQAGELDAGESLLRRAMEIRERALGPDHVLVGESLINLGLVASARGDQETALAQLLAARERLVRHFAPTHERVAMVESNVGAIYIELGRDEEAEGYLRRALAAAGDDQAAAIAPRVNLGEAAIARARRAACAGQLPAPILDEALPEVERALADARRIYGDAHPLVTGTLSVLGEAHLVRGDFAAARQSLAQGLALHGPAFGEDNVLGADLLLHLAEADIHLADLASALALLDRAAALTTVNARRDLRAAADFTRARALWERRRPGDRDRARSLALAALAAEDAAPVACSEVRRWLADRGLLPKARG